MSRGFVRHRLLILPYPVRLEKVFQPRISFQVREFFEPVLLLRVGDDIFLLGLFGGTRALRAAAAVVLVQEFGAALRLAVPATGRPLDAVIVGDHDELPGGGILADEELDQVVGLLVLDGKVHAHTFVVLHLRSPAPAPGRVEDHRDLPGLVRVCAAQESEQEVPGALQSPWSSASVQRPQGVKQVVTVDEDRHGSRQKEREA